MRFLGELVVGWLLGVLAKVAVPEDLLGGHGSPNLALLDVFVPYAVATGALRCPRRSHICVSPKSCGTQKV